MCLANVRLGWKGPIKMAVKPCKADHPVARAFEDRLLKFGKEYITQATPVSKLLVSHKQAVCHITTDISDANSATFMKYILPSVGFMHHLVYVVFL